MIIAMKNNDKSVGAREKSSAEKFASDHSIPKAYGSYQEIADDPNIDVVYIGAIHTEHYRLSKLMLESGKHVLCEKPLCVNLKETESLMAIAKKKNLFLMEGIWSRCFPAYEKVRCLLRDEIIGKPQHVQVQFGKYSESLVPRMREKEKAGGALLDLGFLTMYHSGPYAPNALLAKQNRMANISLQLNVSPSECCLTLPLGIYAVQFAQLVFDEKPIEQSATGSILKETGVDTACHISMRFSENRTALASTSVLAYLPNEGFICGTKGTIKVCFPFWCPTRVEVSINYGPSTVYEFPLPSEAKNGCMNFRNSEGFVYEAEEVRDCIMKGRIESPLLTWDMSLRIAAILDQARKQIGYDLPQDGAVY